MTTHTTTPAGATLHLGGNAYAHPSLTDRLVPIETITPYPGNPRRGDQDAITASIRDLGLYTGVVAQKSTGHILVGNHRRHGLMDLGAERIPVDFLDVDDVRAAAIVARDNRTSDQGTYDDTELLALLTSDIDVLLLSGYDEHDIEVLRRAADNLAFVTGAGDEAPVGVPVGSLSSPLDLDADRFQLNITIEATAREELYTYLAAQPWVINVTDPYTKKPQP